MSDRVPQNDTANRNSGYSQAPVDIAALRSHWAQRAETNRMKREWRKSLTALRLGYATLMVGYGLALTASIGVIVYGMIVDRTLIMPGLGGVTSSGGGGLFLWSNFMKGLVGLKSVKAR